MSKEIQERIDQVEKAQMGVIKAMLGDARSGVVQPEKIGSLCLMLELETVGFSSILRSLLELDEKIGQPAELGVVERLGELSDDQRVTIFSNWCTHCGCSDPRCQCWNDE